MLSFTMRSEKRREFRRETWQMFVSVPVLGSTVASPLTDEVQEIKQTAESRLSEGSDADGKRQLQELALLAV